MQKLIITFIITIFIQTGNAQVLDHFIPSRIENSDESIASYKVQELNSINTKSTFGVEYLQDGTPIASVKAAIYDLTSLDFDEKEYKNSLGYELVDIGLYELHTIPFPIFEFDDHGQHKYMTQFSVLMKDHKLFEIQNFYDLEKYDDNTRQLRYIISSSDWGGIIEILTYFFHQTSKSGIDVNKGSHPVERIYIEDYDFTGEEGFVIVYATGHKPEKLYITSKIWKNGNIESTRDYLVNSRGARYLRINDLPKRKKYQRITIKDENESIILDNELKDKNEIKIPFFKDISEEESEKIPDENIQVPKDRSFSVFPSIFSDQITISSNNSERENTTLKKIAIMNQTGKPVRILNTIENEVTLDTSTLRRGMYFIQFYDGNSVSSSIVSKI